MLDANVTLASLAASSSTVHLAGDVSTADTAVSLYATTLDGPGVLTNAAGTTLNLFADTLNLDLVNDGTILVQAYYSYLNGTLTTATGSAIELTEGSPYAHAILEVAKGFTNHGLIDLNSEGAAGTSYYAEMDVNGTLTNAPDGTIRSSDDSGLGGGRYLGVTALDNAGTIDLSQAGLVWTQTGQSTNTGTIDVSAGDLTIEGGGLTNKATGEFNDQVDCTIGGSTVFTNLGLFVKSGADGTTYLNTPFYNGGVVQVLQGILSLGEYVQTGSGSVGSSGGGSVSYGNLTNGSQINLNDSLVTSSYAQAPAAVLNELIGGLAAGTEYGQIQVSGGVALAGTLNVTFTNGFVSALGESFTIISNGGTAPIQGSFAGLAEGAVMTVDGRQLMISYAGGLDHRDVVLTDVTPPTSTINVLPTVTTSTSFTVSVTATDPDGANGLAPSEVASIAIYDATNGGAFALLATVTPSQPSATFTGQAGNTYGFYSIATDNAGDVQPTPASAQQTVRILPPLSITSIAKVSSPTDTAVSAIDVTFSLPVGTGSLSPGALTLTYDGGSNLINSSVSLSLLGGTTATYAIGPLTSLTTAQGAFTLTVNAADITDPYGNPGTGSLSTSWLMDTTPPTSHVNALAARGTSLSFPVSVTGSDPNAADGGPAAGVASYAIYASINGGPWARWTTVPASNPTANYTGASNTSYSFYSIAEDLAGNVENKSLLIEASTYLPDLTPPVTSVDATSGANPSTVNSTTGTFTLDLTGSDPGGAALVYFQVFVSVDGGTYQDVGPYAIPAGFADSNGNYHSMIAYQGLTDSRPHTYSFYSIGLDAAGNLQEAPKGPNVTFANQVFAMAQPGQLQVSNFTVEHGSPSRSFIQYLDLGFNESDAQSGAELTAIINSIGTASPDIMIYKYDLNGDTSSKVAVPLSSPTMLSVLDHAIEINFGSGGIGNSPTTTAPDGYYEVDIKLPSGQVAVHHFDRLLGDVAGDGIVNQNDLNAIAASISDTMELGWAPLSAAVTGDGTVSSLDLLLATRSKNRKLGSGLALG